MSSATHSCSSIDLGLEMAHLNLLALSVRMTFRKSSDGDIEVIAVVLADILYKVDSMVEAVRRCRPFGLSLWRIAA